MKASTETINQVDVKMSVSNPLANPNDLQGALTFQGDTFLFSNPVPAEQFTTNGLFAVQNCLCRMSYHKNLLNPLADNTVPTYTDMGNFYQNQFATGLVGTNEQYIRFKTEPLNATNQFDAYVSAVNVYSTYNGNAPNPNGNTDTLFDSLGSIGIQGSIVNIGNFADEIQIGTLTPGFGCEGYGTPTNTNFVNQNPYTNPNAPQVTNITIGNSDSNVIINGTVTFNGDLTLTNNANNVFPQLHLNQTINELSTLARTRVLFGA